MLIGSLGKWASSISKSLATRSPWLQYCEAKQIDEMVHELDSGHPRLVLLGALGGRTGLEATMAYAEISRMKKIQVAGKTLMPGLWEGQRRLEAAEAALGILASGGIRIKVVNVHVREDRTLQEWGSGRRAALENTLFDPLA